MKKELIKTQDYLLVVDDSEIKEGDCYLSPSGIWFYNHLNPNHVKECKKIIAHLPLNNSPILEGVPLLPPLDVEDVWSYGLEQKLNELPYEKHLDDGQYNDGQLAGFEFGAEWGYNKAREKYKYTEEDMIRMAIHCWNTASKPVYGATYDVNEIADEYIQSLSQPKMPTYFEFEMESMSLDEIREHGKGFLHGSTFKIKTTTNSQGQEVACGKYIY